jgi:putative flavoprotein involved in K+ transport
MRDRGEVLDAAVVGGGFAGLAVSGALKTAGLSHVVFEKSRPCQTWMTQRWDSFRMNTPNVLTVMPGETYPGRDPEGAMTRDEFVASVLANAVRRALPVESGTGVSAVEPNDRGGFDIHTPQASSKRIPSLPRPATSMSRSAQRLPPGCLRVLPRSTARTIATQAT